MTTETNISIKPFLLYGSTTSPFVRRVRIVADMCDKPYVLIDTMQEEHQQVMRQLNPIWKVPVAQIDGLTIFDSHSIVEYLLMHNRDSSLAAISQWSITERVRTQNIIHAINGVLEACIQRFYCIRDGIDVSKIPYMVKHEGRAQAIMLYLEQQLETGYFNAYDVFGLSEIYLICALDWMKFRNTYDFQKHANVAAFYQKHSQQFVRTSPC